MFAQTNPTPAACGLPTEGDIRGIVTYTLTSNCVQTDLLSLHEGAITIVGNGFTIDGRGVDDSIVKMFPETNATISDVTFLGGGIRGAGALHLGGPGVFTIEDVTIRGSKFAAILASAGTGGTYNLRNILIEQASTSYVFRLSPGAAILATSNAEINITNIVMRDIYGPGASGISSEAGGKITISGCYTAERVFPQEFVTWGDESTITTGGVTGPCTGTIGNGDDAVKVVPPTLPAACGLPSEGYILESVVYYLTADCQQTGLLRMPVGSKVVINGNGHTIRPAAGMQFIHAANNLTIRDVVLTGGTTSTTIRGQSGAIIRLEDFIYRDNVTSASPILLYDTQLTVVDAQFENNQHVNSRYPDDASVFIILSESNVIIRNAVFRNNAGGAGAIWGGNINRYGANPVVEFQGCILFENNTPADIADPNGFLVDNRTSTCTDTTVQFTVRGPAGQEPPRPRRSIDFATPASCHTTNEFEAMPLGSIACIFRARIGGETALFIYEINDQSVGVHILSAYQSQLDAAVGESIIAVSPDGRALVVMWADRNVTIKVGPDHEGKILHLTLDQSLHGRAIGLITTYGAAPGLPYLSNFGHVPASAAADTAERPLQGCQVTTTDYVNFRRVSSGQIMTTLTPGYTLSASARTGGWFKVNYDGNSGWISAGYVTTQGACA